jgi:hypothetical protein
MQHDEVNRGVWPEKEKVAEGGKLRLCNGQVTKYCIYASLLQYLQTTRDLLSCKELVHVEIEIEKEWILTLQQDLAPL